MFELFDHTADIGLRVQAADLETLFAEAGRGFLAILVDNPDQVRPSQEFEISLSGQEGDYVLFDWLNELLYRFETEQLLFCDFDVRFDASGVTVRARGEVLDPVRHRPAHEVKAITYHGLTVHKTNDGWLAEVILDI